jgi:mandelamide amidase
MLLPFRASALPANVADFTLTQAVAALRRRSIRMQDLVDATMRRHAGMAHFGAFISPAYECALEQARDREGGTSEPYAPASLQGIPVAVKDNMHVAGLRNTAGTPALARFRPARDATVVRRLRDAGALFVGKTNMHELSLGVTSRNCYFGDVRNARDPSRLAGGSSGGSAVAVALGLAYAAIGTDTAGSIRIPAALNGIVGFRPTVGRYPSDGMAPVCPTRDTPGPMARTVADVALVDQVITGSQRPLVAVRPESVRLGVAREFFFEGLDAQVHGLTQAALRRLEDSGVQLIELSMPGLAQANEAAGAPIGFAEFWPAMERYLHTHETGLSMADLAREAAGDDVRALIENFISPRSPHRVPADLYEAAIRTHRPALRRMFLEQFCRHKLDGIIMPTTIAVAAPLTCGDGIVALNDQPVSANYAYLRNTLPASNAGLPGLAMPAGYTADGQAVGIEIDGPPHGDRHLLAVGLTVESILAVPARRPYAALPLS